MSEKIPPRIFINFSFDSTRWTMETPTPLSFNEHRAMDVRLNDEQAEYVLLSEHERLLAEARAECWQHMERMVLEFGDEPNALAIIGGAIGDFAHATRRNER